MSRREHTADGSDWYPMADNGRYPMADEGWYIYGRRLTSHKPYIFNKDNVYKFSRGAYCAPCPARDACPFDAPYPVLWARLFGAEMPDR